MRIHLERSFSTPRNIRSLKIVTFCGIIGFLSSTAYSADRDKSPVTIDPNGGTKKSAYKYINEKLSNNGKRTSYEVPNNHKAVRIKIKKSKIYGNKKVFHFHSQVKGKNTDNDGTNKNRKDRVRTEIKVGFQSPKWMRARPGNKFKYEWEFRIPSNFKDSTSFTHFFQIKAAGGNSDDSHPIVTLSTSNGTAKISHKARTKDKYKSLDTIKLSNFKGKKLKAICKITVGDGKKGRLNFVVKDTGPNPDKTLLSVNRKIDMWRGGNKNAFVRPKWGIYRAHKKLVNGRLKSLNLNNETILFRKMKITKE